MNKIKHKNFDIYYQLAEQYCSLLSSLDDNSVQLLQTAPKFFKQITNDISKNYSEIVKIISFNERFETRFELKEKKLERKLIKLKFKALRYKDKIDRKLLEMKNKLDLLPYKLELTKAKVQFEKASWVYFGQKIKLWFKTWFGSEKPKLTRAEKKALRKEKKVLKTEKETFTFVEEKEKLKQKTKEK